MEKNPQAPVPEIVFGSSDPHESRAVTREVRAGRLHKLASRLYTSNLQDEPAGIVRRNLYLILGRLFPGAVVSHRSALEGGLADSNTLFLTYKYTKKIELPGVTLRLLNGPGRQDGDTPFLGELYLASRPRALLENLQPARTRTGPSKAWSRRALETYLDNLCRIHGPETLNRLRDQARKLAATLGMTAEHKKLDRIIGAILGTREAGGLRSEAARARAAAAPFDPHRVELFTTLFSALQRSILARRPEPVLSPQGQQNLAFFEAYFSNYIEGTEFVVEEAADIVFRNKPMPQRPADAHDIIGTYRIVSNNQEMGRVPRSAEECIVLLKSRHGDLLSARPEVNPGQFKETINRAGGTVFVAPELLVGTLNKGLEIYQALEDPLARALFMMFLVAEVHPFADGNGRIARIMMNAELVHGGCCRILVPTVYREDYLLALRTLSRQKNPEPYVRMLEHAQEFTANINFSDYDRALETLRRCHAFQEAGESRLKMLG